jgi:adenylate cyclase
MTTRGRSLHGGSNGGPLAARAGSLIALGTAGYPPKSRRRLKSINVGAFTIAASCGLFALTYALEDFPHYRGAVAVNLVMMAAGLITPAFHRINDYAGALFMAIVLLGGLFLLVAMVGRMSGIQINFVATSAAVFLVFELKRLKLIVSLIVIAIALHIAAWILFPEGAVSDHSDDAFMVQLYVTIVVTISIIIAVLVYYAFRTAEIAEAETDALLQRILPLSVVERLKAAQGKPIADSFDEAAVLFADLAGFVPLAHRLGAARTVDMLNDLVKRFDRLAAAHGVEKIKTIGDAYMAASGVPVAQLDSAARLARMALRMQNEADAVGRAFGAELRLRIGMALGPVMAGVIGAERFGYDVWGDAVNLAARLEQSGETGRIHTSNSVREALSRDFEFVRRGPLDIKGIGTADTWFLEREKEDGAGAASA